MEFIEPCLFECVIKLVIFESKLKPAIADITCYNKLLLHIFANQGISVLLRAEHSMHIFIDLIFVCETWHLAILQQDLLVRRKSLLICFEIMLNFFPRIHDLNLVTVCFTALQLLPSSFPATFHISNLECLLRFSDSLLFSCIWDPSSPCVSYSFY